MPSRHALWPWIVAALISLPLLYLGSFGPAGWAMSRMPELRRPFERVYWPVGWVAEQFHPAGFVQWAVTWYGTLGMRPGQSLVMPVSPDPEEFPILLDRW